MLDRKTFFSALVPKRSLISFFYVEARLCIHTITSHVVVSWSEAVERFFQQHNFLILWIEFYSCKQIIITIFSHLCTCCFSFRFYLWKIFSEQRYLHRHPVWEWVCINILRWFLYFLLSFETLRCESSGAMHVTASSYFLLKEFMKSLAVTKIKFNNHLNISWRWKSGRHISYFSESKLRLMKQNQFSSMYVSTKPKFNLQWFLSSNLHGAFSKARRFNHLEDSNIRRGT